MSDWYELAVAGGAGVAVKTLVDIMRDWVADKRRRTHQIDDTDSERLARILGTVERHIIDYDAPMRDIVGAERAAIHRLEERLGMPKTEFVALPELVPLLESLHSDPKK